MKLASFKYNLELIGEHAKFSENDDVNTQIDKKSVRTKMIVAELDDDISSSLKSHKYEIQKKISEFQERDSRWTLLRIVDGEF